MNQKSKQISRYTIYVLTLLALPYAAYAESFTGRWSVSFGTAAVSSCAANSEALGNDTIKVSQKGRTITFRDGDKHSYSGKASNTGFFGTYKGNEDGIDVQFTVNVRNVRKGKGVASAVLTVTSGLYTCSERYYGTAQKKSR